MVWGQFAEGLSKDNILQNPKTGWLILSLDKFCWRGKAVFTHTSTSGPEFDFFNNTPLFRYNSYFGIHRVYYMDLLEQTGKLALPMGSIISAEIKSIIARTISPAKSKLLILNQWTKTLIDKLDNLKFLSYIAEDGYPVIIPVIQAQTNGSDRILFSAGAFGEDIARIPPGASLAFFCMSFAMEDVVVRGTFQGLKRKAGFLCGEMDIEWVYSPMPPVAGQVYPPTEISPVMEF
jgi:hypothetical protein